MARRHALHAMLVLLVTAPLGASDWPRFQGPNRNGTSEEEGLLRKWPEGGPPVSWQAELGAGFGGAAVRDGEVYLLDRVVGERDILRVFDLETGEEKWSFAYESEGRLSYPGSRGVPTVEEKFVYVIGGFGQVHCIDRKSHEVVWRIDIPEAYETEMPRWGWAQSPIVHGDLVILAVLGENVGLVALQRFDGEEVWRTEGVGSSHSTPTIATMLGVPQVLFVGTEGVYAFDPENGKTLWKTKAYQNRIPITAPTRIDDRRLFITGGYGAGSLMLELAKTDQGFEVEEDFRLERGSQIHVPIVLEGHLFMAGNENDNSRGSRRETGGLQCYTLDGKQLWRTGQDPYLDRGNLLYADGRLYVQDGESGDLLLVDPSPQGFREVGRVKLFAEEGSSEGEEPSGRRGRRGGRGNRQAWAPMALSNGRLLIRSQDELKCLDLRASGR